jgi:hypothetical protein
MEPSTAPDPLNRWVWLMLVALGAVLCLVGWYRFLS